MSVADREDNEKNGPPAAEEQTPHSMPVPMPSKLQMESIESII